MILNETLLPISVLKRNIFLPSAVFFFQQNYQSYSRAGIERTNEQRASVLNNCSDETELNLENSDVCGERNMNEKEEERTMFNVPCDIHARMFHLRFVLPL